MNKNITLYTTMMCPVCGMLKEFLANMNIPYKEIHVDLNPVEMIKLVRKTKRISVPQTNINGEWVFGFDPVRMLEVLTDKTQ